MCGRGRLDGEWRGGGGGGGRDVVREGRRRKARAWVGDDRGRERRREAKEDKDKKENEAPGILSRREQTKNACNKGNCCSIKLRNYQLATFKQVSCVVQALFISKGAQNTAKGSNCSAV